MQFFGINDFVQTDRKETVAHKKKIVMRNF